jgi:hypothetical protein
MRICISSKLFKYFTSFLLPRNIHPPKIVVTLWSLAIYIPYTVGSILYFTLSTFHDQPYSLLTELCARKEPREVSVWRILILAIPNFFNVMSLISDILLIRFLQRTILPVQSKPQLNMSAEDETNQGKRPDIPKLATSTKITRNRCDQAKSLYITLIGNWISTFKTDNVGNVPIRVSILSSLLIVPFVAVQVISVAMGVGQEERTYINWIALATTNTLRCPLTVILAFKTNQQS